MVRYILWVFLRFSIGCDFNIEHFDLFILLYFNLFLEYVLYLSGKVKHELRVASCELRYTG